MDLFLGDMSSLGPTAVVQVGPAWWQTLLVAIGGGALTLVGTVTVGIFARRSSRNTEWFRRVQWAQGLTSSSNPTTQTAGYRALDYLSESRLAGKDDQLLLERLAMYPPLDQIEAAARTTVDQAAFVLDNEDDGKAGVVHDESD